MRRRRRLINVGSVSKAFTKEDDDGGFTPPPSSTVQIPPGPFRLTATGARMLAKTADARIAEAVARAEVLPPQREPERAALGVTVVVADDDEEKRYRLVSAEERMLTGDGVSVESPIGRALLGAEVGDTRRLVIPKGRRDVEVVRLEGEDAT
jgi:hypothetical protein